jgi:hypothetical protein
VIWAGDPRQYLTYKTNRFHEDKKLWMEFKHRILNLFTLGELWEQYSGMELFFIMRQYLPNYFLSVRYRQGFEAFIGGRPEMIIKLKSHLTDRNKLIEDMVEKTNGQINLGDFFLAPPDAAKAELVNRIAILQHTDRNMNPLKNFLLYCKQEEIPVVILNIPQAKGINDTPFFKIVNQETKQITETFDNAIYLEFPEMDYDISLFAEAIHYNTKGNSKLNKDFTERVYPEIIKFLEKKSVKK